MWFSKYTILEKREGLKSHPLNEFLTQACSKKEFEMILDYANGKNHKDFPIPQFLKLPKEYLDLLGYANGGIIINGEREFGYFDMETIREFYIDYGFIMHAPEMLPIAFNGGGTFYVYNFNKNPEEPTIHAVHSSCVGDNELTYFLGNTLDEVLSKTIDIDEEIDEQHPEPQLNDVQEKELQIAEKKYALNAELKKIKEKKNNGEIDLKTFIKLKREIEQQLNKLG